MDVHEGRQAINQSLTRAAATAAAAAATAAAAGPVCMSVSADGMMLSFSQQYL